MSRSSGAAIRRDWRRASSAATASTARASPAIAAHRWYVRQLTSEDGTAARTTATTCRSDGTGTAAASCPASAPSWARPSAAARAKAEESGP